VRGLERDLGGDASLPALRQQDILLGGELSKIMMEMEAEAAAADRRLDNGMSSLLADPSTGSTSAQKSNATFLQPSGLGLRSAPNPILAANRVAALDSDGTPAGTTTPRSASPRFQGYSGSLTVESLAQSDDSRENTGACTSPNPAIFDRQRQSGGTRTPTRGLQTSSSSTLQVAKVGERSRPNSPNSNPSLINIMRREMEHLETRLNVQIGRVREGADAALQKVDKVREVTLSRLDQKVAQCEVAQSKLDRKMSELSGTLRGLSDEAQSQIRRADSVDSRLWDFRHQLEEEFRQKLAEMGLQMQDTASSCRLTAAAGDEATRKLAQQVKRLEGQTQELSSLNTSLAFNTLQERLEAVEVEFQMEAENTKLACQDMISTSCLKETDNFASAATDGKLWEFEHQLADISKKVERIFMEAHGDKGWDARFQEHEVRLSGIRAKLESQEGYLLSGDERFRQDTEPRLDQIRRSVQDTASRQAETHEKMEALVRWNMRAETNIEELSSQVAQVIGQNSAPSASVQMPVSITEATASSQIERVAKLEDLVVSLEQQASQQAAQQGSAQVSANFMQQLQEVHRESSAVAERAWRQDDALRLMGLRLESFEMQLHARAAGQSDGVVSADQDVVTELREQVADLVLRMPTAERIANQTNDLAGLAMQLGEVQRDTARHLAATPVTTPRGITVASPEAAEVFAGNVEQLGARVAETEAVVSTVRKQLAEVLDVVATGVRIAADHGVRSPTGPMGQIDGQLGTFDQVAGIDTNVVANELGSLFHRVEEGEEECTKLQDQLKGRIAVMDSLLDKVAREVLGPDGAEVAAAVAVAAGTIEKISGNLPNGIRLCVLGGTSWKDLENKELVETIARRISLELAGRVVVITSGTAGVQETFVQSLGPEIPVVNLVSSDGSGYNVGQDIEAGACLEDRMVLLGQLGDVYLTVEGGPVVAKEARAAFARGAAVLPLICTSGASAGMFDFPAGALQKPSYASEAQWSQLSHKNPPELTAAAVVQIVQAIGNTNL